MSKNILLVTFLDLAAFLNASIELDDPTKSKNKREATRRFNIEVSRLKPFLKDSIKVDIISKNIF